MKIAVIGSTGSVGRMVVAEALSADHEVTALCRSPSTANLPSNPKLRLAQANVFKADSLTAALRGQDVLISCIGPTNIRKPDGMFTEAFPKVIMAAMEAKVNRIVVITSDYDGSDRTPQHKAPWFYRAVIAPSILNKLYDDMQGFENWTEGAFGIDYGRPLSKSATEVGRISGNTSLTVVRPYNFKNWSTKDFRAVACSTVEPGIPDCSYNTSRAALARFLALESWKPQYGNKAVLVDTPPSVGCLG